MTTFHVRAAAVALVFLLVAHVPGALASNNPPIVLGSAPAFARPNVPVAFVDRSYDSDGTVVSRDWDLDGDGTFETSVAGGTFWHTYTAEGEVAVKQRATDDLGASTVRGWRVLVDGTPPVTTVTMPAAPASGWYATSVPVTISRTDGAGSGIVGTTITLDGTTTTPGNTGDVKMTVSGEGVHKLSVSSRDRAGNEETTKDFYIRIDASPPEVKLAEPTVGGSAPGPAVFGGVHFVGDTVALVATAEDDHSDVLRVEFYAGTRLVGVDTNGADGWTASWDTSTEPAGPYELRAVAENGAQLVAASSAHAILLLNPTVPTVSGSASVSGQATNDGDTPAYVAPHGEDRVEVTFGSDPADVTVVDGPDQWEIARGVAAFVGLLSDRTDGGTAGLWGDAFVNGLGCSWQTWGGSPHVANGFPPTAGCNFLVGGVRLAGHAYNDGDTPAYVVDSGEDAVEIETGPGGTHVTDMPDQYAILRGVAAFVGLASDGGENGGAGLEADASLLGATCHVQTWGGSPSLGYGFPPSAVCPLVPAYAQADVSAANDGSTPAYVAEGDDDSVRVDSDPAVSDGPDAFALARLAAAAVGWASDGFNDGGHASAGLEAAVLADGCAVGTSPDPSAPAAPSVACTRP